VRHLDWDDLKGQIQLSYAGRAPIGDVFENRVFGIRGVVERSADQAASHCSSIWFELFSQSSDGSAEERAPMAALRTKNLALLDRL
jgi:hypothetical protein